MQSLTGVMVPTSGSWLDMVGIFFGIITKQAIRRGTFESVPDLKNAIRSYIDGWNYRCHPFTWTKDADTILAKARRTTTSLPGHWVAGVFRRVAPPRLPDLSGGLSG